MTMDNRKEQIEALSAKLYEAQQLEESGDLVSALKAYRDVYSLDEHCQSAILGLGRLAYQLGKTDYAFEFFVKLLIENHEHPWGYWGRAAVFYEYGQDDHALHELDRAVTYDQPASKLRIDIASLYNALAHYDKALDALSIIRDDFDEDAEIEYCYASILSGSHAEDVKNIILSHERPDWHDMDSIWILLKGLADQNQDMIEIAIKQDPELENRLP